jgi:hypothetical protein
MWCPLTACRREATGRAWHQERSETRIWRMLRIERIDLEGDATSRNESIEREFKSCQCVTRTVMVEKKSA